MMLCPANRISLVLLASLLCLASGAQGAPAAKPGAMVDNFRTLAAHRPRACEPLAQSKQAPRNWRQGSATCAWQGLLQMRRWEPAVGASTQACVSQPALWWGWAQQRHGIAPSVGNSAWRSAWPARSLSAQRGAVHHLALIEGGNGSPWVATEWTWLPSPRIHTRAWQQKRWDQLRAQVARQVPAGAGESLSGTALRFRNAWELNLRGRAGEVSDNTWLWQADGTCLNMLALAPAESHLPLPYKREDARLEQRAAMQIQLARRAPGASWLVPFRLVDLPDGNSRVGSKYMAVWQEKSSITGQLWIPTEDRNNTLRARILASLGARPTDADASAIARVLETELTGIAAIWSATHER